MHSFLKHTRCGSVMDIAVVVIFALIGTSLLLDYAGSSYARADVWVTKTIDWIATNATVTDTNGNRILRKLDGVPTAWGNSGASSLQRMAGDGTALFRADEVDTSRIFGLSLNDPDLAYQSVDYGIMLDYTGNTSTGLNVSVYENGVKRGTFFTNVTSLDLPGNYFYIDRVGTSVRYNRLGYGAFYNSTVPSSGSLLVDVSLKTAGATIANGALYALNHPPTVNDQTLIAVTEIVGGTPAPSPLAIDLGVTDTDGDPLQYYMIRHPSGGTLSGTMPNALLYTPDQNFTGKDSFEFKVFDGYEYSTIGMVTIYVWSRQRLDAAEGTEPTLSYAPNGDLRVFYNIGDEINGNAMVVRTRRAGEAVFGPEDTIWGDARTAAAYYHDNGLIELAVDAGEQVRMFTSTDNGATWDSGPFDYYSGRELLSDSDAPMPLGFTTDLDYVQARLFFNYMTDYNQTNIYYAYKDKDTQEWQDAVPLPTIGGFYYNQTITGTYENGDHVGVFTDRGLLFDEGNQDLSFDFLPGGANNPLNSTDMAVGVNDKPYFVQATNTTATDHTLFIRSSNNYGVNWDAPQPVVEHAAKKFQIPHLAVSQNKIAAAWLEDADLPSMPRLLRCATSNDGGTTWSDDIQTIIAFAAPKRIGAASVNYNTQRGLDIESHETKFAVAYSVMEDANNTPWNYTDDRRGGVYLMEIDLFDYANPASTTFWVDANASFPYGDGSATHPFRTIQEAIDLANEGYEIRIVQGTYTAPAGPVLDWRSKNLRIIGGYSAVNGTYNPAQYPVILDGQGVAGRRVIYAKGLGAQSELVGVTVRGGSASGNSPDDDGGGMYVYDGSMKITNCIFENNTSAGRGGGLYLGRWSGGMGGQATLANCIFRNNNSGAFGGGVSSRDLYSFTVTNCVFENNTALNIRGDGASGGGMFVLNIDPVSVTGCTFINNYAETEGGGLANSGGSNITINRCTFKSNTCFQSGGAIRNWLVGVETIINCVFWQNKAGRDQAGNPSPCGGAGGAVQSGAVNNLLIHSSTFNGNSATLYGQAIDNVETSPTMKNCILWDGGTDEIYDDPCPVPCVTTITYSNIQGGHVGEFNIDANPYFSNPASGDLRLTSSSPCIDTGTSSGAPNIDIAGQARPLDGNGSGGAQYDMGAYEYKRTTSGGGCFLAGTKITLADGSTKPIEDIRVGDMVLAFDEKTNELKADKVKQTFVHPDEEGYLIINGRIKATANHPVYAKGQWREIGTLEVGDELLNAQGKPERITSKEYVQAKVTVYNIEVNPFHTYIADNVVVHNKGGGGCFLAGTPITMADGSIKPIEQLKVGDKLLAFDEKTGGFKPDAIKHVFVFPENDEGYFLINKHLKVTPHHTFYVEGKWIEAGKLAVGDQLLNAEGKEEPITSLEYVKAKATVYNLEVNPYHTFIAGGVVVHNATMEGGDMAAVAISKGPITR